MHDNQILNIIAKETKATHASTETTNMTTVIRTQNPLVIGDRIDLEEVAAETMNHYY